MDTSTWIAIYLPLFIVLIASLSARNVKRIRMKNIRKKRGGLKLSSELIKDYIGKECNISLGSYSTNFSKVKIVEIIDNWMKIEGKGKVDLVNIDFIQSIKILPRKE